VIEGIEKGKTIMLTCDIGPPISKALQDGLELEFFARCAVLIIALQTANDKGSFGLGEKLGTVGEVLDDPEGYDPCHDRRETFQNKDPRPGSFPTDSVHIRDRGLSLEGRVNRNYREDRDSTYSEQTAERP